MKSMIFAAAAVLALAGCTEPKPAQQPERPSEAESLAYIDKQDRAWAEDALKNDPALLETILAEDYSGVAGDGTVRNKAQEVAFWADLPPVAGAEPPKMTYKSYGDTVLAQGDQVLTPSGGGAPVRILWTDVWMFRDGKWQVAGSQNATVPATD